MGPQKKGRRSRQTKETLSVKATLAARLTTWREYRKLTQLDLAYLTTFALETVRSYERGRREPRITEIVILAEALQIPWHRLITEDPPPGSDPLPRLGVQMLPPTND